MQTWETATHRIVLLSIPGRKYSVRVFEKAFSTCILSQDYEYWQRQYAWRTVTTLVELSGAVVAIPQREVA